METSKEEIKTEQQLNFTVPLPLYNALDAEAARLGQTKTSLIRWILNSWFAKNARK
jgi:hypothetical protein